MHHLGFLHYRDFWDNHGPMLHYAIAPLLSFFGESDTTVLIIRFLHSILGIGILIPVYWIARLQYDRTISILSVLVLSFSEIFLQKSIEVRTDQFLVLFWLFSIWSALLAKDSTKDHRILLSGFLLGCGMLFSPKALVCLAALSILIMFQCRSPFIRILKRQIFLLVSFLIPIFFLGMYLHSLGTLQAWIDLTILQNLTYPDTTGPIFLLLPQNLGLLLLGFAGMWFSSRKELILSIAAIFPLLLLIFLMPSPYSQSALIITPIFSIYAAYALKRSMEGKKSFPRILFPAFAILAAAILPIASFFFRAYQMETNRAQMTLLRHVLKETAPDEVIFDGNSTYVFRRQAYYYGSLVGGIRYKLERGEIQQSVEDALRDTQCRVVIYDDRVSDLPAKTQEFLRTNYFPTGHSNMYIAGKNLSAENLSGNKANFRIEIPQVYEIKATGRLLIDGKPYQGPLLLDRGSHELVSDRELSGVQIRATSNP